MNKYCKEFLESITSYRDYWLNLDDEVIEKSCKFTGENPTEYRMNGLIFSLLVMIDGDSSLNNFKHYNLKYGGKTINKDIYLHENIFKFLKNKE